MAQFHIYRLPNGLLVMDLQSDLIDIGSRIVAPLVAVDQQPTPLGRLEPIFSIDGVAHSLRTAELAAVPQSLLNVAPVQEESARDYDIRRALDLLFTGI